MNQNAPNQQFQQQDVPPEIKKWNWGAFLLGPIWAIGNRVWIGLLGFIPWVNIIIHIILGIKGNEWAWKQKQWNDVEHFKQVQKKWAWWALVIFIISFVIFVLLLVFLLLVLSVPEY